MVRELGRRRKAAGNDSGDAAVSKEAKALNASVRGLDRLLPKRNHELTHARQDINILQKQSPISRGRRDGDPLPLR